MLLGQLGQLDQALLAISGDPLARFATTDRLHGDLVYELGVLVGRLLIGGSSLSGGVPPFTG